MRKQEEVGRDMHNRGATILRWEKMQLQDKGCQVERTITRARKRPGRVLLESLVQKHAIHSLG